MKQEDLILLLDHVVTPIYQIEVDLGMPKTTLQKALKGERNLPKKWALKLREVYGPKESDKKEPPKDEQKETQDQAASDWKQRLIELRQTKTTKK